MKRTVLLSFLFVSLSILHSCKPDQKEVNPEYRTLVESVYASVTVEPQELYQVFPTASGVLKSVLIEEGDTVSINELLAEV